MANYYNISYFEVGDLPHVDFDRMAKIMSILKARERLLRMEEVSYPHLKNEDRKQVHRRAYMHAFPEYFEDSEPEVKLGKLSEHLRKKGK